MSDEAFATAITAAGPQMDRFGWVPATAGNISARPAEGAAAVTRSGRRDLSGQSDAGDLVPLFAGCFDRRVGAEREAPSYTAIAAKLGLPPGEILFLSDMAEELDAAAAAGMQTCQSVRAADGMFGSDRHPEATGFPAVAHAFGLPAA